MQGIIIGFIAVAILGIGGFVFISSPSSDKNEGSSSSVQNGSFKDIQAEVEQGNAYLLDVRTPAEFNEAHFENAHNFDSVKIAAGTMPDIPKNSKIYVYCRSGNRSSVSAESLKQAGFSNIVNLGGLDDVKKIGGNLTK